MTKLELEFHDEMRNIYKTAKNELGYKATRLKKMIADIGGVKAAKKLIAKDGGTEGFEILWEYKRLDLSVEALVLKMKYCSLFSEDELELCENRLADFGYEVVKESKPIQLVDHIDEQHDMIEEESTADLEKNLPSIEPACKLMEQLRKLRQSSKEAIEGIEEFSEFKKYMHVEREVESELSELLKNARLTAKTKHLMLVCGSVGDGKSHVISQMKHAEDSLLDGYDIHNDATESDDPSKDYKQILDDKFVPFSDDRVADGEPAKLIVAINLGTLSNFIEDPQYKSKYSILRRFIDDNKIIEDEIVPQVSNDVIEYVNFSDYSLYSLTSDGPTSDFMNGLISKITNPDSRNPFNNVCQHECEQRCSYKQYCPLYINYKTLSDQTVRAEIVQVIIESLIKHKIIVSVRALLDFIYSIIVPIKFESLVDQNKLESIEESIYKSDEFLQLLLPNIVFCHKNKSPLFTSLYKIDPMNERLEEIDELIVKLNTMSDKVGLFNEIFNSESYELFNQIVLRLYNENINDFNTNHVLYLYFRVARLTKDPVVPAREIYGSYVKELYYYNTRRYKHMRRTYNDIIDAIYRWNGIADENWININDYKFGKEFIISQKLDVEPDWDSNVVVIDSEILDKFEGNIKVKLKDSGSEEAIKFLIDYDLFELLQKVKQGYKLNNRDKENYIAFIDSLSELLNQGKKMKSVKIVHKFASRNENYVLKKDKFGGYTFEKSK